VTGNIGFHHVHHLAPRVPNYNLEKAHESTPPLHKATTITLRTSLKSLRFRLFDQQNKSFVSFKEIKHLVDHKKSRMNLNNKRPKLDKN
ncbi:fatty acid desaturase, partial (plasmid) [Priestia endophytica]